MVRERTRRWASLTSSAARSACWQAALSSAPRARLCWHTPRPRAASRWPVSLVASGAGGIRKPILSTIVAEVVFTGVGKVVERDDLPGDPDEVSRDDLVFAEGSLHPTQIRERA